ncbi:MAG: DUF3285 domain-containing protein [Cyanobacteriota bacterium]|nr:DUF3285 domain-containing protein [Cyanobacteriota bacterium]
MSNPSAFTPNSESSAREPSAEVQKPPSYVKLAMRNMVRKGGTSLKHFFLSTIGVLACLIGLSYLTR